MALVSVNRALWSVKRAPASVCKALVNVDRARWYIHSGGLSVYIAGV